MSNSSFATWSPVRFTGREDDGTGLDFYRSRYYSPDLGRFISEDPAGLDEAGNQYAYAGSNPVSYSDPAGLSSLRGWATTTWTGIPAYQGDPDFAAFGPVGLAVTPNGAREAVAGRIQQFKDLATYASRQVGAFLSDAGQALLSVLLPPNPLPGGNTRIEIPRSQKQDIIDEFFGGRPTRPLRDRNTGALKGEITTDAGPARSVIYEHSDRGTPEPHINLHDDATGTNIHVILK